jgi:hypothetical protein
MRGSLKKVSVDELLGEIKRRRQVVNRLKSKHLNLLKKVALVEAQIRASGGEIKEVSVSLRGGKRPKNPASLPEMMIKVMKKDKPMSVAQIESAVNKEGYKSTSSTFKTIIFQALGKNKRFKKVARGRYSLA